MDIEMPSAQTQIAVRYGLQVVPLHGLEFLNVDEDRFVDVVVGESKAGRGGWVITPNTDIVRLAHEDPEIRALVREADALVADGMPLVWASHLQSTPLRGRVCGSNLIFSVPEAAAEAGLSVFLLGGAGDTGEITAQILKNRSPSLKIVGTYSPPFGFEKDPAQFDAMISRISEAAPDIVFVALSFPKGERLIQKIRKAAPNAWWIGVGAAFDFVSGVIKRAPEWMQQTGTEWLFRLSQDPKRLAERYLVHDLPFAAQLLRGAVRRRVLGR
jgi:N-acetylglucosaminyldiphosphoundecaprenol N-acetyl-beta-D-mannosaminyltransferase